MISAGDCAPLAGAAVYLWHGDRAGLYSLYSAAATNQNYPAAVYATTGYSASVAIWLRPAGALFRPVRGAIRIGPRDQGATG